MRTESGGQVAYSALESHAFVDAEEQHNRATGMESISEEPCIFLLGCPDAISLRFDNVLHIPRFDDEESFLDGCLSGQVSEYALNARMLSFRQTEWM
jgi:hypothetical protein